MLVLVLQTLQFVVPRRLYPLELYIQAHLKRLKLDDPPALGVSAQDHMTGGS